MYRCNNLYIYWNHCSVNMYAGNSFGNNYKI